MPILPPDPKDVLRPPRRPRFEWTIVRERYDDYADTPRIWFDRMPLPDQGAAYWRRDITWCFGVRLFRRVFWLWRFVERP